MQMFIPAVEHLAIDRSRDYHWLSQTGAAPQTFFNGCRFEVETDGEYMNIIDVSLEAVTEEGEEEDDEVDEDTAYGGPVCFQASPRIVCLH